MKKNCFLFTYLLVCVTCFNVWAAVSVKKAAPVATQQAKPIDTASSLVPTVLSLASGIKEISAKQKALDAECKPTTTEINFVNNMMKEFAKTGAMTALDALGTHICCGNITYKTRVQMGEAELTGVELCWDCFEDPGTIWNGYPMASVGEYCDDGVCSTSSKNKKTISNIYDVFNLIDFTPADYTAAEATVAAKLLDKMESCSYARLSAKKREAWGEFLTTTIGNVGTKTNTATIMESVTNVTNSGSGLGGLSSLGSVAAQFLNK
ncbi:MAG: hypothetical protein KBS86_01470 [Proteobacteria bacterium]|nr:hypothetical protein [Candidatus Enterousia scatequi]